MSQFLTYLFILSVTIFTVLGDTSLKKAGQPPSGFSWKHLLFGLGIYLITGIVWFFIYRYMKFSVASSIYGVFTALVCVIVGSLVFNEQIRITEIIGILLGVSSVVILGRFG